MYRPKYAADSCESACKPCDFVQNLTMSKQDDTNWGRLAALGMEVAVGVVLGAVIGNWLDKKYHWDPWGTLIGTVVGFSAGLYSLVKAALGANDKR